MLKGRDVDQKRAMIRDITAAFTRNCGADPGEVNIVIVEVDPAD
jgi:phenylpyruvate tautomerase PptA (4-oxalocrotonate tautomerase family)